MIQLIMSAFIIVVWIIILFFPNFEMVDGQDPDIIPAANYHADY